MRTWMVGVIALLLVAAQPSASVEVADPCGDIVYAEVGDDRHTVQPDHWASFDLESVRLAETGDRDAETYGVEVTIDVCGEIALPDSPTDHWRTYRVGWRWGDDGCTRGLQVGNEGTSVHVVGGIGVGIPSGTYLFESCPEHEVPGVAATSTLQTWELDRGRLEIDGGVLTVLLSPTLDPALAHWFAPGEVWAAGHAWTRADAPMIGVSWCLPPDGPASDVCGRVRDGDDAELGDLPLSD